jgi:putative sigma-54 modulation protein
MKITVTFKGLEHTPSLDERIREKSKKLDKYLDGNTNMKWFCYVEDQQQIAEITLLGPKFEFHARAHSDSLYKSLDLAVDKVEKQMKKQKDKWKNHIHNQQEEMEIMDPEQAWSSGNDRESA